MRAGLWTTGGWSPCWAAPAYTDDPLLTEAVAAFVLGLDGAKVLPLVRRANTFGALDMGLAPGLLPGRLEASSPEAAELAAAWGSVPEGAGERLPRHSQRAARGEHPCPAPGRGRSGARRRPWPARRRGAVGCRVRGGARPVPHRLIAPRRRGPPGRGVRREGRDGDQPRGPGATGQPGGFRAGSDPLGLVGARRPRRADGGTARVGLGGGDRQGDRRGCSRLPRGDLGPPRLRGSGRGCRPPRRRRPTA